MDASLDNETLQYLVCARAIETISQAILHPTATSKFIHRGIGCLNEIVDDSIDRSNYLVQFVGLEGFIDLGVKHKNNPELQTLLLSFFAVLAGSSDRKLLLPFAEHVLALACDALESHSSKLPQTFQTACCVILAWGPPPERFADSLVENIPLGLRIHFNDRDVQDVGKYLLTALVGPVLANHLLVDL